MDEYYSYPWYTIYVYKYIFLICVYVYVLYIKLIFVSSVVAAESKIAFHIFRVSFFFFLLREEDQFIVYVRG